MIGFVLVGAGALFCYCGTKDKGTVCSIYESICLALSTTLLRAIILERVY
jgi:hypothetical protein